jgi:hypothetical protein
MVSRLPHRQDGAWLTTSAARLETTALSCLEKKIRVPCGDDVHEHSTKISERLLNSILKNSHCLCSKMHSVNFIDVLKRDGTTPVALNRLYYSLNEQLALPLSVCFTCELSDTLHSVRRNVSRCCEVVYPLVYACVADDGHHVASKMVVEKGGLCEYVSSVL